MHMMLYHQSISIFYCQNNKEQQKNKYHNTKIYKLVHIPTGYNLHDKFDDYPLCPEQKIITEFVGLRSKLYSLTIQTNEFIISITKKQNASTNFNIIISHLKNAY